MPFKHYRSIWHGHPANLQRVGESRTAYAAPLYGFNEQRLLAAFPKTSFSKEDAARVLGISESGAYKLMQRMKEQGVVYSWKEGKKWVYRSVGFSGFN